MSGDRELLELAARAAGIALKWKDDGRGFITSKGFPFAWNPLTYDGDALRLAAKLGMDVCMRPSVAHVYADMPNQDVVTDACYRRAITRAAAEIGKAMP